MKKKERIRRKKLKEHAIKAICAMLLSMGFVGIIWIKIIPEQANHNELNGLWVFITFMLIAGNCFLIPNVVDAWQGIDSWGITEEKSYPKNRRRNKMRDSL